MKILVIHNEYIHHGGEDEVVRAEKEMLESHGHDVVLYQRSNSEISNFSFLRKLKFVLYERNFSRQTYNELNEIIRREKPDVAHIHNALYLLTASAYQACFDNQIPIVQTLHNYRPLCPTGVFYRSNKICEDCLIKNDRALIVNKCWKNSYFASWMLHGVISRIKKDRVYSEKIDRFIALSEFSKQKFVQNGIDSKKIKIKPNFLKGQSENISYERGEYALFIGSLQNYKGIEMLVQNWKNINQAKVLKVIGSGPLEMKLKEVECTNIKFLGQKSQDEVIGYIQGCRFLIVPSQCYETFSRVVMEAFACSKPVLASRLGAFEDIIEERQTGMFFDPSSKEDLIKCIEEMFVNDGLIESMGNQARGVFDQKYGIERNHQLLTDIYKEAIGSKASNSI